MALSGVYCFKVGMTQVFDQATKKVKPATVVRVGKWVVCQIKTQANDGYAAIKVGVLKSEAQVPEASADLTKFVNNKKNFLFVKEIRIDEATASFKVGQILGLQDFVLEKNTYVDISGTSKGIGFQGVMRRHGFSGGPKSHGSKFHRIPGSMGNLRRQGEIWKGKKLPGRTGSDKVTVQNLAVLDVLQQDGYVLVGGAVPGKKNGLLYLRSAA